MSPRLVVTVAIAVAALGGAASVHADASVAAPAGLCDAALARARAAFVADIDGDPDGFTITRDRDGVRVRYFATLDMCGVYDDYRARTHAGRVGFRVVDDDGHHAGVFEARFRPALRACLAAR